MKRPKTDHSKGIPEYPEDWEWMNYADYLEAELEELRAVARELYKGAKTVYSNARNDVAVRKGYVVSGEVKYHEVESHHMNALAEKLG